MEFLFQPYFDNRGDIAQLVERTVRNREARGSIPLISNNAMRIETTRACPVPGK